MNKLPCNNFHCLFTHGIGCMALYGGFAHQDEHGSDDGVITGWACPLNEGDKAIARRTWNVIVRNQPPSLPNTILFLDTIFNVQAEIYHHALADLMEQWAAIWNKTQLTEREVIQ